MRIGTGSLGTRVARRVLGILLLCALLPVALTVAFSYDKVQRTLIEERAAQLSQAAEGYSSGVFERLSIVDYLSGLVAAGVNTGAPLDSELKRYFKRLVVLRPGLAADLLLSDTPADTRSQGSALQELALQDAMLKDLAAKIDKALLASNRTALVVLRGRAEGASQAVWLVRALSLADSNQALLVAEIDGTYLWGHPDGLPYLTSVCVLSDGAPMHCSEALPETALALMTQRLQEGPAGHEEWTDGAARHLSAFREIRLPVTFGAAGWGVVMTQPDERALAPVRAVRRAVIPVLVLGLLFAALFSFVQVRRMLRPLKDLSSATKRIAARDFAVRVPVKWDDEFGELADSLNGMSERLGRQFHVLSALAKIDAVILSKVDFDQIATIVLERVQEVVQSDCVLLLLLPERVGSRHFIVHALSGPLQNWHKRVLELDAADMHRLVHAPSGLHMGSGAGEVAVLEPLAAIATDAMFALPILLEGALRGALVVGHDAARAPSSDEAALLQDLADRVAVALATAVRDLELHRRANYDLVTQLPNRLMFLEELAREIGRAERHNTKLAVLFVDLDGFAAVNDSLGHGAGDELLVQVASQLKNTVRKGDLVARLGGDEFTILLPELRELDDASIVARHIIEALSEPFNIGHGETFICASIGIAMFPTDGANANELLRHADMAMYRAKEKGRGTYVFFEEAMNREAQRRYALARELRQALESDQFVLYYQAQLDLGSNRIVGAEALIRWRHPTRGLVPPLSFIAFAEESGLIEAMGEWALVKACAQFVQWRAAGVALEHISVNVSPRQFRRRDFPEQVSAALAATGMDAARLRLEITESVLIDDSGAAEATLAQLVALGVALELDDFGTGYSSLGYLQRLPVETIKLDRSFIADLATSEKARAIAQAAIGMVHALNKDVVAEGVETEEQLALLRRWGCNAIQGFLLSQPVAADAFAALVRQAANAKPARLANVASAVAG